jgi:DNA-binding transcriptional MerR regulator
MDVLVTIGEFSRMTHLSVKALRHYHEIGVLEPAEIDAASGYRRYAADQVASAQLIRRFRELEMPLDEVRAVLEAPDAATRNAAIATHLERMERRLGETRAMVASLRSLLQNEWTQAPVEYRRAVSVSTLAIRQEVTFDECGDWLGVAYAEIEAAIARARGAAAGPAGALYPQEFFEAEKGEVIAFIPVANTPSVGPAGRVERFEVAGGQLAVMEHRGAFADLDRTYGALGTVVAARRIGADGPIREHYLVTDTDTDDVSRHRTEVCWPISTQAEGA